MTASTSPPQAVLIVHDVTGEQAVDELGSIGERLAYHGFLTSSPRERGGFQLLHTHQKGCGMVTARRGSVRGITSAFLRVYFESLPPAERYHLGAGRRLYRHFCLNDQYRGPSACVGMCEDR